VIKVFRKNEDDILFNMTPDCIIYIPHIIELFFPGKERGVKKDQTVSWRIIPVSG